MIALLGIVDIINGARGCPITTRYLIFVKATPYIKIENLFGYPVTWDKLFKVLRP